MNRLLFILLFISGIDAHAVSTSSIPHFMLGAGLGLAKSGQNVDGAKSATGFGLSADAAYSPIDSFFAGFDIHTFGPAENIRATNYMFSTSYRYRNQYTAGLLVGMQSVVNDYANGSNTDPLTGNVLAKNNSAFSYGLKISYDKIIDIGRGDFNLGFSPVLMIVKTGGNQQYNQVLLLGDFRIWGY